MPPHHLHVTTPVSNINPRKSREKYSKGEDKKMSLLTKKKLIPILVFILASASVLRLLKITMQVTSSSPARSSPSSSPGTAHHKNVSQRNHSVLKANSKSLTEKERRFLFDLIARKSPCNLLVFGLEQDYSSLPSLNAGGKTVFLEDDPEKVKKMAMGNNNNSSVYKIEYPTLAKDAFKLLKRARNDRHCSPSSAASLEKTKCKLALRQLPMEVHKLKWDVVLVDGPCGHEPECPGRMASIYTAGLLARKHRGSSTNVLVHDADRMIEMWFSWEFLCEGNLVSSKGTFWNFHITGGPNGSVSTTFCSG